MEKQRKASGKHFVFALGPLIVLLVLSGTWIQVIKPLAIRFITEQIPKVNSAQNIVTLKAQDIDISLLRLQVVANAVTVSPHDGVLGPDVHPEDLHIKQLTAQLDFFDLIIGQINLSKLVIDTPELTMHINGPSHDNSPPPEIPTDLIFKYLKLIPVDRIMLVNTNVVVDLKDLNQRIQLQTPLLTLINKKKQLSISLKSLWADLYQETKPPLRFTINLDALLNYEHLAVTEFNIQTLSSQLELQTRFDNVKTLLSHPEGAVNLDSRINLEDLRNLGLTLFPQKTRTPAVTGVVETSGKLDFKGLQDINGHLNLKTSQVGIDHFKLGQAQIEASINKNDIELNEIDLEHPSGNISIQHLHFNQRSPYNFSAHIESKKLDLQKLFQSLNLQNIPASFQAAVDADCSGLLQPLLSASCQITTDLSDIWVKSSLKDNLNIIKINSAKLSGHVQATETGLDYTSAIQIGSSAGTSEGHVGFKEGFNLKFATDKLSLADIETLANLNIKGDMKIAGETHGDSSYGVINSKLTMNSAEVEDFRLGTLTADLSYKDAALKFDQFSVAIGQSVLTGQFGLNFKGNSVSADILSDKLNAEDVLYMLNKKFNLPFSLSGVGHAEAHVNGPLDFWKMSYNLKSHFDNGILADEKFSSLTANLNADGKRISFDNVQLKKSKSQIRVTGQISTESKEPEFELIFNANPFLLEESDHILAIAPSISGVGYSEGQIKGPLSAPELTAHFTLKQVSYDKVEYPNSQGEVSLDKKYLHFNGQFFGRQIQTDLNWPWNEENGFSAKVLVHDLNPLFLLPLISIPQPSSDYSSLLNAELDLSSKNRHFNSAEGFIRISDFNLQRGSQFLKLDKPSRMNFSSGLTQMDPISLTGEDKSYLHINLTSASADLLKFNIATDLQLRLFHFLIPFTQNLSGNLVLDSQVILKNSGFELFGEGELADGLVALKGFPQAIEDINTPIEFSKSKIFLNDITGQLGQSDVTGVGQIEIVGPKNIIVNLKAVADNIELNFPDKVRTNGRANVSFTGNTLPYTLKADYKVSHGLIEKDFGQDSEQSTSIKASSFLPPQQAEQLTPSLLLDVNVDLTQGVVVKDQLVEGEASGQLKIQGTPESPSILGKIDIKPGSKLIFKDKPFDIQTASIQFQSTKEINPDIYISANSRVSDYDISLLVQGNAKNLSIKPTSQPPLSENDIFSLLALGVTSQGDQNLSSDTQQKQTGLEVLAAISNQSQLNKRIQEKLGLTLQLAPSVDSTKNIAVPKVVVSKKITNKINASYSKPFTGNDQNQEIKLQYLYNNNLSLLLNYQNKDTTQQEQVTNSTNNSTGILGIDLEYRDDFK